MFASGKGKWNTLGRPALMPVATTGEVSMDDLDARIAARPAAKVTPERIAEVQKEVAYHRLTGTLTVCVITLANGFTVTGESACASPENYDETIGNELAYKQAVNKIWALEGYVLRNVLAVAASAVVPPRVDMETYVGTKCVHARPMLRGTYIELRGWELPANENASDDGYLIEYTDKLDGNVEGFAGYVTWTPADVFERAYIKLA